MAISYDNPAAAAAAATTNQAQTHIQLSGDGLTPNPTHMPQSTQPTPIEGGLEIHESQNPTVQGQNQPGLMLLNEISAPPYPADTKVSYNDDKHASMTQAPATQQPISPMSTGVSHMLPPSAPGSPPPPMHTYPATAPTVNTMPPQQTPPPGLMSPQLPPQPHIQPQHQPQPQPQPQMQTFQQVPTHAPTNIMPLTGLQSYPGIVICPSCNYRGQTVVMHESGGTTHLVAALTCFVTCLGCIPYLINGLKDVRHRCAQCGTSLAVFHRSGRTDALVQVMPIQAPQMQQPMQMPMPMPMQMQQPQPQPVFTGHMPQVMAHPMQQYPAQTQAQQQQHVQHQGQQQGVMHVQPAQ